MSVIVFQSSKGGVGKTTSAILTATCLAKSATVSLVDGTHNAQITDWAMAGNAPSNLRVVSNKGGQEINEDNIGEIIQREATRARFVIVDLDGIADARASHAVLEADIVIIPMQGSQLDAKEANRSLKLIIRCSRSLKRTIPFALLVTRTNPAVRDRETIHAINSVKSAGLPLFATEINERAAYRSLWSYDTTLDGLAPDAAPNLEKAKLNVQEFVRELLETLVSLGGGEERKMNGVVRTLEKFNHSIGGQKQEDGETARERGAA